MCAKLIAATGTMEENISRLRAALDRCDCVLIGAGSGLSTAAGYIYTGERFNKYFADFGAKYGFDNMYFGGFTEFSSPEEFWAYWCRYIYINRYVAPPKPVYETLLSLVADKDHFVLTTNVDHCFQRAGFDKKRLFYTQGDYGLFQCTVPCSNETFDNEQQIKAMFEAESNMRVPTELIPKCPNCGKPVKMNLRSDNTFIEDWGWLEASERYQNFLRTRGSQKMLLLELGVGYNTPAIIKIPFLQMTVNNPKATYACINMGEAVTIDEIRDRSICINGDIAAVLNALKGKSKEA